jgi:hypothetical protein
LTKCNNLPKKTRQEIISNWVKELTNLGAEDIYMFEDCKKNADQRLKENIAKALPLKINEWETLTLDQKNTIGKIFHY